MIYLFAFLPGWMGLPLFIFSHVLVVKVTSFFSTIMRTKLNFILFIQPILWLYSYLKLRQYFPPYVCHYIELLIENNNFSQAKKYLYKSWCYFPHPDYRSLIKLLSTRMHVSYFQLADYITSSTKSLPQSKILIAESLIDKQQWIEAKNQLTSLLEHKPSKEVCL